VDLDRFMITAFCWMDDTLKAAFGGQRLRQRGPMPALSDAEVLTMEAVGEYLGFTQDLALYRYFRRHYTHFFPALGRVHRTTFIRQAANLWKVKELVWRRLLDMVQHDPTFALVDSFPLPVCQFARAYRCRRFQGEAAFGKDTLVRQTFYGFRVHVRCCWPGVITQFDIAPANVSETAVVPELAAGTQGLLMGDRNYWNPVLKAELEQGFLQLEAPFRRAATDPWPRRSALISRIRYRIDTTFGQLVDRYQVKRVWARDSWHLHSRLLRKVLSHTLAVLLNQTQGNPPMQLAKLVS
jgi:DDE family transposase